MSVGHSVTYSLSRLIDHNQIWSAGIYLSSDPCKPFWILYLPYFQCQRENMQNFAYCVFLPLRTWRIMPYDLSVCLSVSPEGVLWQNGWLDLNVVWGGDWWGRSTIASRSVAKILNSRKAAPFKIYGKTKRRVTDVVGGLGEVNKHGVVVGVASLSVVPDSVSVQSIGILVYQYVPALTCTPCSRACIMSIFIRHRQIQTYTIQ